MRKLIYASFLFLILLGCLLFYLVATPSGSVFLINSAKRMWPHISYAKISGSLTEGLQLKQLKIEHPKFSGSAEDLYIKLNLRHILFKKIIIENLDVQNAQITIPTNPHPQPFHWQFPIDMIVKESYFANTQILYHQNRFNFGKLFYKGTLNTDGITFNQLELDQNESRLVLDGFADLNLSKSIDLNLHLIHFSPSYYFANLRGDINGAIQIQGALNQDHKLLQAKILTSHFGGVFQNLPFMANINLIFNQDQLSFKNFSVSLGDALADIKGNVQQQWDLMWSIKIPNLKNVYPVLQGQLISNGQLYGDLQQPQLKSFILINGFKYQNYQLKNFNFNGNIDSNLNHHSNINAELNQLQSKWIHLRKMNLNFSGTLANHQAQLTASFDQSKLNISALGHYSQGKWAILVNALDAKVFDEAWALMKPQQLSLSPSDLIVSSFCLAHASENLCGQAEWHKKKNWLVSWSLKNFSLKNFLSKFHLQHSDQMNLQGVLNGSGVLQAHLPAMPEGTFKFALSPTQLVLKFNDELQIQTIERATWQGILNSQGFTSNGLINFGKGQQAKLEFNLPKYQAKSLPLPNQAITGQLQANLNQINFLSLMIHHLANSKGNLLVHMQMKGTLHAPELLGQAQLRNASADIPSLDLTLKNINITASGNPRGTINYQGSLISGNGRLNMTGTTRLYQAGFPSELFLKGSNVMLADTEHYKILGDPNLMMRTLGKSMNITGSLFIPHAWIKSDALRPETLEASSDIVFVGTGAGPTPLREPLSLTSKINIKLGNDIQFDVRGAMGKMGGQLLLNFDPQTITTGYGELNIIDGKYTFYGQNLVISRGRLIYNGGDIENPGIDIQATRKVNTTTMGNASFAGGIGSLASAMGEVTVGVNLTGSYRDYQVSLFADPPAYNQNDILSLLIFGQVTDSISGSNANQTVLLNAASSLNLGGGQLSSLTQQLQSALGLSKLGLENQSIFDPTKQAMVQNTAFVVGKRIGQRLYVSYSVGLLDPISVARIRFDLARGFYVQSENSTVANGVDVFYSFER